MSRRKRSDYVGGLYAGFQSGNRYTTQNPAMDRQNMMERMYLRVLGELAMNRFQWTGFPDSVDTRFLEKTLYFNALSVFYFDKDYDKYFALTGAPAGPVNMMDNPLAFLVTGNGFVNKTLAAMDRTVVVGGEPMAIRAECVPIWANYFRHPDLEIVHIYAHKFAIADRTIEINLLNARRPKMIASDENTKLSAINIARQVDEGQELIQINSQANTMGIIPTALDMEIDPKSHEQLHILKVRLWNECLGLLGINGANQDKKERLVSDEVSANDEQVNSSKFVNLNSRKAAADAINKRYDLDVKVEYHTDIEKRVEQARENMGVGVE